MSDATEKKPAATRRSKRGSAADQVGERAARYRKERGLKVTEVARAIGVTPSLISQIERGQSQPSVSTLFGLAEALDVPVDAFFDPGSSRTAEANDRRRSPTRSTAAGRSAASAERVPQDGPSSSVGRSTHDRRSQADSGPQAGAAPQAGDRYLVRRGDRAALDIEGGVRWERLTPENLRDVEFLELVYAPGAQSHPDLYRHPGTEMVLVLSGRLDIVVGFERYELEVGDSIHFPSTMPHRYVNPSDTDESRAVSVILHDDVERSGPDM